MRLWSLHPALLDRQGLVACWRESLLAQAVLAGNTVGYRNHPQLLRFREEPDPLASIGLYLEGLRAEAEGRGYRFDASRILHRSEQSELVPQMAVTDGQLEEERRHLRAKLELRSPDLVATLDLPVSPHPLFHVIPGPIASWERSVEAAGNGDSRST